MFDQREDGMGGVEPPAAAPGVAGSGLQGSLFGVATPEWDGAFDGLERVVLGDGAWIDLQRGWLRGDLELFEVIRDAVAWRQPVVRMYDRDVVTPRLVGDVPLDVHPAVGGMVEALSDRYGVRLDRVSAGYYRGGGDSVAWHGDRVARDRDTATVATVSLGGPRRFLARPASGAGRSRAWMLGHGDLVVMGGTFQRTWRHAVPKVRSAPPRIALMLRHAYD